MAGVAADPAIGIHEGRLQLAEGKEDKEEVRGDPDEVGGPRHLNLGVAPDMDGVGVVTGVPPAPEHRLLHRHEQGEVQEDAVQPSCAEGGAVTEIVRARIAGRVDRAVDEECWNRPPCAPGGKGHAAARREEREPESVVDEWTSVFPLHQRLEGLAIERRRPPPALVTRSEAVVGQVGPIGESRFEFVAVGSFQQHSEPSTPKGVESKVPRLVSE